MPVLSREPEVFPPTLFRRRSDDLWWVAYVRSRQEKGLARHLLHREVAYYLPQRAARRRVQRRWRLSYLPLFPGYLFFRGGQGERRAALKSNVVVDILEVDDQERLHEELEALWLLQESGVPLVPQPYVDVGDPVEVVDGPLKGYRGKVVRCKGRVRLVVSITLLRRSVAAELDRDDLAPLVGVRSRLGAPVEGAL